MTLSPNPSIQQQIDAFHQSLQANSIAERKKSFNSYLNSLKTSTNGSPDKISAIVDGIVPQTLWENILKLDIIIHFELFEQALEILKSEHKIYVAKLLRSAWFIKKLLVTYTPKQFVDELFCYISVSARTRIINRLLKYSKNEDFGKQLFETYREKYGLRAAKQLLPLCPVDVIEDVVLQKNIKLSTSTRRKILDKNLKLAKHFFEKIDYRNRSDIKYIARNNLSLFVVLVQNTKLETNINCGNSTTHKLIKTYKNDIINDKNWIEPKILKLKRLYFDLKTEYEQLVFKLIAEKSSPAAFDWYKRFLHPLPKQKQLSVFLSAFEAVAKCKLEEKREYIEEVFLKTCVDVNERDRYAELRFNLDKDAHWIKYMRIEKSIPLLKEKINMAQKPNDRQWLVVELIETCRINNDKVALLNVLKYATRRFRNDEVYVRNNFCSALMDAFKLYELSQEHWKYINELQKIFEVNNEHFFRDTNVIQEQIIFFLNNKQPIGDLVAKLHQKSSEFIQYDYRSDVMGVEKELILQSVAYWNGKTEDEDNSKFNAYLHLLNAMQLYNSRHSNDQIAINRTLPMKWMIENLENALKKYLFYIDYMFLHCILDDPTEDRDKVIRLFLERSDIDKILLHFIKKEPMVFVKNIDVFLQSDNGALCMLQNRNFFRYYIRQPYFLELNKKIIDYCKSCLQTDDHSDKIKRRKIKSLTALSICLPEKEYLQLIKQYNPDEAHLNTESDECTQEYQLRQEICENLLNSNAPSAALESLLPFCVGDYLKFALKSLNHLFHHAQERKLPKFVRELETRAVSVRKHSVFFSLTTLDRNYSLEFLKNYADKEQNTSLIAHVLQSVFKYFTKNLDKDFFGVFKVLLKKIDKNDETSLKFVTKDCVLPEVFVADYVEFVWNTIEEFAKEVEFHFESTKFDLLQRLKERDYLLCEKFLNRIIKENFLKDPKTQSIMIDIVVKYLFYCNSTETQNNRLQTIFEIIREFKQTNKTIYDFNTCFIDELIKFALNNETYPIELISEFKRRYNELMGEVEFFEDHLKLTLLELHIESLSGDYIKVFSGKVALFVNNLEQKFGVEVVMLCKDRIVGFIHERLRTLERHLHKNNLYQFLDCLYGFSDSLSVAIIVANLLEGLGDEKDNTYNISVITRKTYENLIEKLKSREEPIIKLLLTAYFRHRHY